MKAYPSPPLDFACKPLDGADPHIYSLTVPAPPYTYGLPDSKYDPMAPPPTYIPYNELDPHITTLASCLKGFELNKAGILKCVDKNVIDRQKGVVTDLIGQMLKNFFTIGSYNNHVSLPVRIFEPRSLVERILDFWKYAPTFLNKAALISDKNERMKQTMCFTLAGFVGLVQQLKPFNPYTGETCECMFDDGTRIYTELTEHNPPTIHFQIYGAKNLYLMTGYYQVNLKFQQNHITGSLDGNTTVKFFKSPIQTITFSIPRMIMGGMVLGDRTLNFEGNICMTDKENKLRNYTIIGTPKGKDQFAGKLYKYKEAEELKEEKIKSLEQLNDVESEIASLEGSLFKGGSYNGIPYWSSEKTPMAKETYNPNCLPSDWRYREDLIWLIRGKEKFSDNWKKRLEETQRRDRKLRASINKLVEKADKKEKAIQEKASKGKD